LKSDRQKAIELIKQACCDGARKKQACEILGLSMRTIERWQKERDTQDKRCYAKKSPKNKLTEHERRMILMIANSKKYRDLPPCKIVPMLADEDKYIASESSFYRILRTENQLLHRGHSNPRTHRKPDQFIATKPNQVWSWDISYLPAQISGLYFYLYLVMDIYSRKIVGWSIHEKELSEYSACLIEQACHDEKISRNQIVLHSDNGSPMKGITMLTMLEKLGVLPSFSRPSVSDDNPYSEALFKTLKYHSTFPSLTKFSVINDARMWCEKFVYWYNNAHLHSSLKFVTPQQRHIGLDKMIMEKRHMVYQNAKKKNPMRWSKNTRNWQLPNLVMLNPDKKNKNGSNALMTNKISIYPHELDHSKNPAIVDKCVPVSKII
jgi:transposase InsO family protein